jgi:hypothetical protein
MARYWLSEGGSEAQGPFELADICRRYAAGEIDDQAMVCTVGESAWREVGQLCGTDRPPPPPFPPRTGSSPESAHRATLDARGDRPLLRFDMELPLVVILSVVTLGIFYLIWFYGALSSYRELSGRRSATITLFWINVATLCVAVIGVSILPLVSLPLELGSLAVGTYLMHEVLLDRAAMVKQLGEIEGLQSYTTLMALYVVSGVLCLSIAMLLIVPCMIGVPLFAVLVFLMVSDHKRIVDHAKRVRPEWVATAS